jgi:hypothetical protein
VTLAGGSIVDESDSEGPALFLAFDFSQQAFAGLKGRVSTGWGRIDRP